MSNYDPLARGPAAWTVNDFEPTMIGEDVLSAVRRDLRESGTVYASASSGRHRAQAQERRQHDLLLYGIYAWSMTAVMLGSAFVISLMLDLEIPEWLELTLAAVPGICLVTIGLFAMITVRRCGECGGRE